MAKNTVSEDDLLAGVGGLGSFGNLGAGKPIRDNPFRGTKEAQTALHIQATLAPEKIVPPVPVTPESALPVLPQSGSQPRPKVGIVPNVQARAVEHQAVQKRVKKERKADVYVEKMSTFLSSEMRDKLSITARKLNSNRLVKGDPITSHTLLRCGVRVVTDLLQFSDADVISSEEELMALVERKLKGLS